MTDVGTTAYERITVWIIRIDSCSFGFAYERSAIVKDLGDRLDREAHVWTAERANVRELVVVHVWLVPSILRGERNRDRQGRKQGQTDDPSRRLEIHLSLLLNLSSAVRLRCPVQTSNQELIFFVAT